jgi:Tfp pilus assembly protein PilF
VDSAPAEAGVARNNLALAYGAAGDLISARQWFRRAADIPTADYNYGILMMSTRSYGEAEKAFHDALSGDPEFTLAAVRARQARVASAAEDHRR